MDNISKHITYSEAIKSTTAIKLGIDNTPDENQLSNMKLVAEKIFEPLREGLDNRPINISIFFRCKELNDRIPGASKTSEHMIGSAIDVDNDGFDDRATNREIFDYIKDNLIFNQLIWEHGNDENPSWVHFSYNPICNKNQVLVARIDKVTGKTIYHDYEQYFQGRA